MHMARLSVPADCNKLGLFDRLLHENLLLHRVLLLRSFAIAGQFLLSLLCFVQRNDLSMQTNTIIVP